MLGEKRKKREMLLILIALSGEPFLVSWQFRFPTGLLMFYFLNVVCEVHFVILQKEQMNRMSVYTSITNGSLKIE